MVELFRSRKFIEIPKFFNIKNNSFKNNFLKFFSKQNERKEFELVLKNYFSSKKISKPLIYNYLMKTPYFYLFDNSKLPLLENYTEKELKSFLNLITSIRLKNFVFELIFLPEVPKNPKNPLEKFFFKFKYAKYVVDKAIADFIYPAVFSSEVCRKLFKYTHYVSNLAVFLGTYFISNDLSYSFSSLAYFNLPFLLFYYALHVRNKILDNFSYEFNFTIKRASAEAFSIHIISNSKDFMDRIYLN
ncbi:MAG: hypothetical protein N3D10_00920 [Candidatus Micrarchaeota archaeon]|nr:hypothetical protein [Candidatus Micrarchaeota archaeon]